MEHIAIPLGEIHTPFNWEFADAAARLAASPDPSEVGLVCLQLDTMVSYRLTDVSPLTWVGIEGASAAAGDKNYVHDQGVAASTWSITHNLDKFPSVTIIDSGGDQCEGVIAYPNSNTTTVTFSAAFSGKAYLN